MKSRSFALAAFATALACNGVKADLGADSYMQIPGAQFVRGAMPAGTQSGPAVAAVTLVSSEIWPGLQNDPIGGALAPTATAAAIGLQNDVGYWIVSAGVPSVATPTDPSFGASAAFSLGIIAGTYTLVVRAIDEHGAYGLPSTTILTEEPSPLNPPATGVLVVTLTWDTDANLSLHVIDPDGTEIYWGNQSTEPPFPTGSEDGGSFGYIDYDSNANCAIDGLRREDAIWPATPPPGQYTVRIDTPSLCGQPDANWTVKAVLKGTTLATASGVALDADTMGTHGRGSGVLAFQLTVP